MTGMDSFLILILVLNLYMLGTSRMFSLIRSISLQGCILAVVSYYSSHDLFHTVALVSGVFLIKGILIPFFLFQSVHKLKIQREVEPYVSFTASLIIGTGLIFFSFWIGSQLQFPFPVSSQKIVPTAFATIMIGLFILMSRRKAITQIIGYLVMENGIYIFAMSLAVEMPVMVEVGVLLDAMVGILIMMIVLFQIKGVVQDLDVAKLNVLKD